MCKNESWYCEGLTGSTSQMQTMLVFYCLYNSNLYCNTLQDCAVVIVLGRWRLAARVQDASAQQILVYVLYNHNSATLTRKRQRHLSLYKCLLVCPHLVLHQNQKDEYDGRQPLRAVSKLYGTLKDVVVLLGPSARTMCCSTCKHDLKWS